MKNIIFIAAFILLNLKLAFSQGLNWNTITNHSRAQVYYNIAYDFGMTNQIGVAHKLKSNLPIVLQADFSAPMGDAFDDYKFRIGGKVSLVDKGTFKIALQYLALARKNETNLVNQTGIGQWLSVTTGIYKEGWHLGLEIGYDGALATKLTHAEEMKLNYSEIQDGWFINTGGQWHYGIEASKKIGARMEINTSLRATDAKGDHYNALLPMHFRLGGVFFFDQKSEKQ